MRAEQETVHPCRVALSNRTPSVLPSRLKTLLSYHAVILLLKRIIEAFKWHNTSLPPPSSTFIVLYSQFQCKVLIPQLFVCQIKQYCLLTHLIEWHRSLHQSDTASSFPHVAGYKPSTKNIWSILAHPSIIGKFWSYPNYIANYI